jgi:predicted nucleic acid-binding protein
MNAIDTTILIYRHDTRDAVKQAKARQLVNTARPLALPWQVGCEFIAASRKLRPLGFSEDDARDALADLQAMADEVLLPVTDLWAEARSLQARYSLSLWDALLVAACVRGGVQVLYTEDMGSPRTIDSLTLINPFTVP